MTDKIVVFSTCSTVEEARKLARHLVENRLAACVNIFPNVTSCYRWQGKVEEEPELLLLIKSSRPLFDRLRKEWEQLHSYEIPELIALPIVDAAQSYLVWMETELAAAETIT